MRIGVFGQGWWKRAGEALGHEMVDLASPEHPSGGAYAADLNARITSGTATVAAFGEQRVDLLIDNGGAGLGFVRGDGPGETVKPAHETTNCALCSHFVDPLVTAFQGLGWAEVWQSLQSRSWVKAVWDRAQAVELQQFGVPGVIHAPMAALNRPYPTEPLDPEKTAPIVSFVGGQNTTYFAAGSDVPARDLLAGTLAHSIRADLPEVNFYNAYHEVYRLGEPVTAEDDLATRIVKTAAYFKAKLFYNAQLCLRQRDRFVIFLARKLGSLFHLAGKGWDQAYGLAAASPLPTADAYFNHFREAAINLNLVNGNAETGLNMRHFEITAAGGFMLCHDQPELADCFEIGKECAVFQDEKDLLEKIHYYLGHPEERVAIALAGQRRTLSQHLYSHRLQALLEAIRVRPLPVDYARTSPWEDIKALMPEAGVMLDCGANVGQTAGTVRRFYPQAEIYSFEPVASIYEQLRRRCAELDVHAVKKAVGDRDGRATINLTAGPESNSLLGFKEGNPCAQWTRVVGQEEVEVCTLDRWCQDNGIDRQRVSLLKLDVQGAELQALYGAKKLLETVKLVFLEVSFVELYRDCPLFDDIDRFLTECGYRRHAVYPSDQPHNWGDALYVKA